MPIRHTAAVNPSPHADLCFQPAAQILIACRAHSRVDQSTHSAGSIHRHQGPDRSTPWIGPARVRIQNLDRAWPGWINPRPWIGAAVTGL
eukprot:5770737-Prymnesium_polylepis.1